jgi:two-component system chemotaxis response regulator CheY
LANSSIVSKDPSYRLKKIQVLVVDNDPAIVSLLGNVLKKLGFGSVHTAKDGFEALDLMNRNKMDLVITDWDLKTDTQHAHEEELPPNDIILVDTDWTPPAPSNGSMFLRFIRGSKHSPNPYLAVIMLTGVALRDNIAYARDSGVNEIIVKPISAESLCSRILMVIENDRPFVTSKNYKGPCRRRVNKLSKDQKDRRMADIKVIKFRG